MKNESKEYKELIEKYADAIYRVALSYLRNKDDAEDIVQEVFMKFINNKRQFNDEIHKRNWLIRVAINLCYNEIRKRRLRNKEIDRNNTYYELKSDKDNTIIEYLDKIEHKYKSVFTLYYFNDYKTKEISKILRITEMSVRTRLNRARKMLKKLIEEGDVLNERY